MLLFLGKNPESSDLTYESVRGLHYDTLIICSSLLSKFLTNRTVYYLLISGSGRSVLPFPLGGEGTNPLEQRLQPKGRGSRLCLCTGSILFALKEMT